MLTSCAAKSAGVGLQDLAAAEVCRLLWGLAVLDSLSRKTAATLYGCLDPRPQSYPPLALHQLAQVMSFTTDSQTDSQTTHQTLLCHVIIWAKRHPPDVIRA